MNTLLRLILKLTFFTSSVIIITLSSCAPPLQPQGDVEKIDKDDGMGQTHYSRFWGSYRPYYY